MNETQTPYQPWMRSLLNRMKELYGKVNAKTIAEALPDGSFFKIQGSVATTSDLPASGNEIGDIYIVTDGGKEYIWVTSEIYPDGYWELLGVVIDAAAVTAAINDLTTEQKASVQRSLAYQPLGIYAHISNSGNALVADFSLQTIVNYYLSDQLLGAKYNGNWFSIQSINATDLSVTFVHTDVLLDGKTGILQRLYGYHDANDGDVWQFDYILLAASDVEVAVPVVTPNITPLADTVYVCGTLTSLTIIDPPASGKYTIIFNSGATPTVVTGIDNFTVEANKHYVITVRDGYATVNSWTI